LKGNIILKELHHSIQQQHQQ